MISSIIVKIMFAQRLSRGLTQCTPTQGGKLSIIVEISAVFIICTSPNIYVCTSKAEYVAWIRYSINIRTHILDRTGLEWSKRASWSLGLSIIINSQTIMQRSENHSILISKLRIGSLNSSKIR